MSNTFTESFFSDFSQGLSRDCYCFLGNHIIDTAQDGNSSLRTVSFAVWAPNAIAVKVCGDFNDWGADAFTESHMQLTQNGIWYTEISGLQAGDIYQYQIVHGDGTGQMKSDPFALYSVLRPGSASVVYDGSLFPWTDGAWLSKREKTDYRHAPVNVYELHLGSWMKQNEDAFCNYRNIADRLAGYLQDMHYTHVELMPLCEYTHDGSCGYQTGNYYSVTSRYGTPDDFKYFVNRMHEAGIGVILDWVPGYYSKDADWLYRFDGTWLYEPSIENLRENPYLGTVNFDFSKGEVRSFLLSNGIFWLKEYHIDGLCVKSVGNILYLDYENAHSVSPKNIYGGRENLAGVDFLRELNIAVHNLITNPIMIAEDQSNWPMVTKPVYLGGLGFDFKWNIGWKNDTLEYMRSDPVYRSSLHGKMTFPVSYAFSENFILPVSHHDVMHGKKTLFDKMFGYDEEKFSALKSYLLFMMAFPGKKMLFMGSEFGETSEWKYYDSLNWTLLQQPIHAQIKEYVRALNYIYKQERSLFEIDDSFDGFQWIDADNASQNVFSFVRKSSKADDFLLIVCNFSDISYPEYKIGVPRFADYQELLNSEDTLYGGQSVAGSMNYRPKPVPWNGQPFHINVALPTYGAHIYKPIFPKRVYVSGVKHSELQKRE